MSNIYIQEPPTSGKVLLKTTVGDIDLELWSKEAPKACRNFVQLCFEGYYDDTIFHRIVKGFIVQGGDPTGSGTGGDSIYGQPFKDEIHSRLRFTRRGLVAMANAGKDDNSSQFFFTMAATPELQSKHTIFAKVTGETVYNMIKLEDCLVDADDRPLYPPKILKTEILNNPFPDIVPRVVPKNEPTNEEKKKNKSGGVKNYKLLSFGEEAEEEDEEAAVAAKQYSGRSKSTHDLLSDPKLSSTPAVEVDDKLSDGESSTDSVEARERINRIKNKLKTSQVIDKKTVPVEESKNQVEQEEEEDEEEYEFGKERREERKRKAEEIRQEFKSLKKDLQVKSKRKLEEENTRNEEDLKAKEENDDKNKFKEDYKKELEIYKTKMEVIPKKGTSREDHTLALLAKFKNKLSSVKDKEPEAEVDDKDKEIEGDTWLAHKLHFEDKTPVLAKDASTKDDDWFEITDPRNAINKRRREASKQLLKHIEKRIRD